MYSARSKTGSVHIEVTFGLERQAQNLLYLLLLHGNNGYANAPLYILVIGPSILVYILTGNQQMHQNDNFIVTLLHVSAYQRHNSESSYCSHKLSICLYRKNNGIWSEVAPISIVTLWIQGPGCSVGIATDCGLDGPGMIAGSLPTEAVGFFIMEKSTARSTIGHNKDT
jgi:hypothetical protein